ncbi:hypothetical protein MCOR02_002346 [Pyricularia oryzae]|uniref:Uncharacterized protein n=1 Tax=Pyricularia oryzae TaxID=318829 RepID=A0A4P7N1V9_PYROR|nr:hypothetical protein MCOR01_008156 [Pyricularia oryzae]KAH9438743.1 hypothetical protein MCOR02_002346 [Pyricularia oryzae]KAI6251840.1 hypothetical protein MCOR19_011531 [Pyricularia oryzae]KAI6264137.1 hypothetical protein MCOR26_011558 [Pyricularia oryzae]KAI6295626.1 hypothetical protein MCOR34_009603 [Pyricularia oryzae]
MDSTEARCEIAANPDVSGVVISIYALCLTGKLFSYLVKILVCERTNSEDFSRSTVAALSLQGLSLLCTAVVQTFQGQLTLFHAVVVLHLLALLGINLASRGRYRGSKLARHAVDAVIVAAAVVIFVAFNVYVWVHAPSLGPQPECNASTVYVVFGVRVHATDPVFRYIALATLAVGPGAFAVLMCLGIPSLGVALCYGACQRRAGDRRGGDVHRHRNGISCLGGHCSVTWTDPNSGAASEMDAEEDDHVSEFLRVVAYLAFSIYAIVSLEKMINANNVSAEESEWTFGQVIAIFLLAGTLYELLSVVISSYDSKQRQAANSVGIPLDSVH